MNATARLQEAQLAFLLLTRLPCGRLSEPAPTFAQAGWAFPLVGLVVGLISSLTYLLATTFGTPPLVAAFLAIAVSVLMTGALHEDGLGDVADGFGGGHDVVRKLEIMRDSRVGTYGIVAIMLCLGASAAAIAHLPTSGVSLLIFAMVASTSRAMMLIPMVFLPPARADGLGQSAAVTSVTPLLVALAISLVLALPILAMALPAIWIMGMVAFAMMILARKQIGGQTGDVLGATQKLTEVAGWITLSALI